MLDLKTENLPENLENPVSPENLHSIMKKKFFFTAFYLFVFLSFASSAEVAVYEVKSNTPLDTIAEVPWATLQPGDTVLIHWKPTPYKEKWVICRQGTEDAPITVRGVPNEKGELPVIDGNGAAAPANLNFWSEQRGVIKIGGANVPADTMPKHIIIENLEIRSAHPMYQFTDDSFCFTEFRERSRAEFSPRRKFFGCKRQNGFESGRYAFA
jgi:hypothetical protein